jgi:hypothetical protein
MFKTHPPYISKTSLQPGRLLLLIRRLSICPSLYSACHMDNTTTEMAYRATFPGIEKGPGLDKGPLPAPELGQAGQRYYRNDGRAYFPSCSSFEAFDTNLDLLKSNHVPEPDRNLTGIYGDEWHPNLATTTSSPQPHSITSAGSDVFRQCNVVANTQRLIAADSPISTGSPAQTPFRTGSPFVAQPVHDSEALQFDVPWPVRERDHLSPRLSHLENAGEPATPNSISPKGAVWEYVESEGEGVFPLFAQDFSSFEFDSFTKTIATSNYVDTYFGSISVKVHPKDHFSDTPSQTTLGTPVLQHCPFIARPTASHDSPPRLSSSGTSSVAPGGNMPPSRDKLASTGADSGPYTCTYCGCSFRFQTPRLLKKHKRECHRKTSDPGALRANIFSMAPSFLNTQAGPHRCGRINPGTAKPCNTVFSRPYDLTRHEDTIHNPHTKKVRCNLCTEEKIFSRADALTRHYRVCHPDTEVPSESP